MLKYSFATFKVDIGNIRWETNAFIVYTHARYKNSSCRRINGKNEGKKCEDITFVRSCYSRQKQDFRVYQIIRPILVPGAT